MKRYYQSDRNTFFTGGIDVMEALRSRGYTAQQKNGRLKNAFIYTESGCMQYRFHDPKRPDITAAAGELVFLPKGTVHESVYMENGTKIKMVQFYILFGDLPTCLAEPCRVTVHRADDLINAFFAEACPHPLLCLSRLYEMIYRIDREHDHEPAKFIKLKAVLDDIHTDLTVNRRVSDYAELCDMSEPGFRRLFREYVGESPVDYRNSLRLERARILLESGECNVSEAAEAVGFSNLSFFIRLYKRKYGHTPKNG